MSDVIDKTPQNQLYATDRRASVEVHNEDSDPDHDDYDEPPRSLVQDKDATINIEQAFEDEEEDEEPTAGDICRMIKTIQ
ncbi:hypothetical protein M5689_012732 [Euphorbia peplus]|nr:hypothetical protein M5689_012732 [Euphorbia peplus]